MQILSGKAVANFYRERVERKLDDMKERQITPKLAIICAGDDKPSIMYAKSMERVALEVGIEAEIYAKDTTVTEETLLSMIRAFNHDPVVYGILLTMPLPEQINAERIIKSIDPAKDIDGLTDTSVANLFNGRPGFVPCTPRAVVSVLDYYHISLSGKVVVIVGRSNVVGKPLAQMCLNRNATVTHCHTKTRDLKEMTKRADILISAAGHAGLITQDMVKPGAVVIDVGINRVHGQTVGDVDFDDVAKVASAITPVPGGIGAVTTMMVLESVVYGVTPSD